MSALYSTIIPGPPVAQGRARLSRSGHHTMHPASREWRTRAAYGLSPADVAAGVSALAADYEARRAAGREDEAGIALVDEMGRVS